MLSAIFYILLVVVVGVPVVRFLMNLHPLPWKKDDNQGLPWNW